LYELRTGVAIGRSAGVSTDKLEQICAGSADAARRKMSRDITPSGDQKSLTRRPYRRAIVARSSDMSSAIMAPVEELLGEEREILLWRAEQFRRLGFSETDSWLLAESEADLGVARGLHGGGCRLETALKILL
jgi:hypothetical protein